MHLGCADLGGKATEATLTERRAAQTGEFIRTQPTTFTS